MGVKARTALDVHVREVKSSVGDRQSEKQESDEEDSCYKHLTGGCTASTCFP